MPSISFSAVADPQGSACGAAKKVVEWATPHAAGVSDKDGANKADQVVAPEGDLLCLGGDCRLVPRPLGAERSAGALPQAFRYRV